MLLNCIDEALEAGLIRAYGQARQALARTKATPAYEFSQAIDWHTLYDALNPDRRARLHRWIALGLGQMHSRSGGTLEDVAELAAQHHASAAPAGAAKGLPYALRAAEQARETHAYGRAADFPRIARELTLGSPVTPISGHRLPTAYAQSVAPVLTAVTLWQLQARDHAAAYRRLLLDLLSA